ncbi:adenosylcobinamide-GDP ribazoletransferase [Gemmiger formicilis]|uniref:adenosylcobinamide-GDP ribazoletransferase n=2 Tax=Gemmiger formicilis TaxID=745368 RepID=UPI00399C15CE
MTALQTIAVAFAMFSALPMPQFDWNEKNMRYALCAFPLVGVVCGALWCVCGVLPLPAAARAAGFCLVPVWVTGGIHLDGYADTCDALSSYGDTAKKLEILKDPHCGAFAVIRLCSYFAAYFALCGCVAFTPRVGVLWTLALVGERALSGLAVAAFPLAKNTGLAHTFATAADRTAVRQRADRAAAPLLAWRLTALGGWALALAAVLVFCAVPRCVAKAVWRHDRRSGRVVFAKRRAVDAGGAGAPANGWGCCNDLYHRAAVQRQAHLCRTQARRGGSCTTCRIWPPSAADLEPSWRDELSDYDVVTAAEVGGGVVPIDPAARAAREAAGRLACLLAARADCVVQMFCGLPTILKGELPKC